LGGKIFPIFKTGKLGLLGFNLFRGDKNFKVQKGALLRRGLKGGIKEPLFLYRIRPRVS